MRDPGPRPAGPEVRRRLEARRILRYLGLRAAQACLPMNPLVPLKGVNHLLYSSHTSRCRPGPARPADHFDHHDRSAHHTLRPSCPHPGATRRHSTHSHEPSAPSDHPASKRVFAPLIDSSLSDLTGPGPDPRKIASITSINSPTCDRLGAHSVASQCSQACWLSCRCRYARLQACSTRSQWPSTSCQRPLRCVLLAQSPTALAETGWAPLRCCRAQSLRAG